MSDFKYTSIDSFSTLDGPGIRTVIFLAGCPYRCLYCHNPETFVTAGYQGLSIAEVSALYERNRAYYGAQGGITFSGGEPLLYTAVILALLKREKEMKIALETSGFLLDGKVSELLEQLQYLMVDLKWNSEADYREYSAGSLEKTLDFLKEVRRLKVPCLVRQVVVPGLNDRIEYLKKTVELLLSCGLHRIEFLPYHDMAKEKYARYGLDYRLQNTPPMDSKELDLMVQELRATFTEVEFC